MCLRQPKYIEAVHEHLKHDGAADNRRRSSGYAALAAGVLKRRARGIPQRRLGIGRIAGEGRNASGQHDACALWRTRLILERVSSMHGHVRRIEGGFKKSLIGLELQFRRHDTAGVREHAVSGDDHIAFDAHEVRFSHFRESRKCTFAAIPKWSEPHC
jgi:hypothetical protein